MSVQWRVALSVAAVLGWLAVIFDMVPVGPDIPASVTLFAAMVGTAATLVLVVVHVQRPAEDVWQSGREFGRREMLRELATDRRVERLEERRRA